MVKNNRRKHQTVGRGKTVAQKPGRGDILDASDARRKEVYRTDVAFATEDDMPVMPAKGTPERNALEEEVMRYKSEGLTYTKIAEKLYRDPSQIANLVTSYRARMKSYEEG